MPSDTARRSRGAAAPPTYLLDGLVNTLAFSGFDALQGGSAVNTSSVTAANTAILQGGSAADSFTLTGALTGAIGGEAGDDVVAMGVGGSVNGSVSCGAGSDTLSYTSYGAATTVALTGLGSTDGSDGSATATGGFSDFNVVQGGTSTADSLTGTNVASIWALGVSQTYTSSGVGLTFSAFDTLQGGNATDTFNIASNTTANLKGGASADTFDFTANGVALAGTVDGGTGSDILSYSGYSTSVTLNMNARTATAIRGYVSIEYFAGGSGTDTRSSATTGTTS